MIYLKIQFLSPTLVVTSSPCRSSEDGGEGVKWVSKDAFIDILFQDQKGTDTSYPLLWLVASAVKLHGGSHDRLHRSRLSGRRA